MHKIILTFLTYFLLFHFVQGQTHNTEQTDVQNKDMPFLMKWDDKRIDLGAVKKGEKIASSFTFENAGKEDILIELVTSCKCTELDWPAEPIKPGEKGSIDFTFDSAEKNKSEEISIDIILANTDDKTGYQIVEQVFYTYELIN